MSIDLLVVGGGIGASWGGPAGWAAFLYAPSISVARKFAEAIPDATQAEVDVLPFVAAIQWFHDHHFTGAPVTVLCCSDAKDIVRAGLDPALRQTNDWTYIDWFEKQGYQIKWLWQARDQQPAVFEEAERARTLFTRAIAREPIRP
jgi:hypothetical protein